MSLFFGTILLIIGGNLGFLVGVVFKSYSNDSKEKRKLEKELLKDNFQKDNII